MSAHRFTCIFVSCLFVLFVDKAQAQRDAKVPDADPELERKSFQVADGFEVNLFAADPFLAKPIQMNFDAAGRLWIAASEVYPQIKPGQKATDKVIVLEDTKGVGRADKTTVFAEGLLIPTGLEPGDGGVYVADSTDLVHFADTKGTGKADQKRIVLSGFGTEDTHHILHTLRWGPDGMLYMNQSIYIHSHIETPHGVRRLNAGGVWQFRPETMELGVFLHGFCNPWGHHFDRWGQSFVTDGAYGEGINYGLPGARYVFTPNELRIMWGLNPGSPKHCGLEIVSGRHLSDDWQGNMITNDFRGHRVCRFVVTPDGAGYASREMPELIKTNHSAFRPIDVKMGPDGAIYIADWYNPIIQHGEVDFRDPRRDHVHGRIWRVTAKSRPLVPRPKLVDATTDELLKQLKAPEDWTRHFAKRVLKERGKEKVQPALAAWVKKLNPSDKEYEHHLLEALWTYQSLNVVEPKLLDTLLHARDHRARAGAVRVIQHWQSHLEHPLELLAERVADDHSQVRLEAVRVLSHFPTARAAEIAMQALDRPVDRFLDYALWLTARELGPQWLPEFQNEKLDFGNAQHLLFALQAVNSPAAVKPLLDLIPASKLASDRERDALRLIAALGSAEEIGRVFDLAFDEKTPADRRAHLLACLDQAARQRQVKPKRDLQLIRKFLTSKNENEDVCGSAARLVGLWRIEALRNDLLELVNPQNHNELLLKAAFEGLALLGGEASRKRFQELAEVSPDSYRFHAVIALASLDESAAAKNAVDYLSQIRTKNTFGVRWPETEAADIIQAFVQRKNGARTLAAALAGKKIPADVAKVGVRTVQGRTADVNVLVGALKKAGGLETISHGLSAEELKRMIADVADQGNSVRGEVVFRRKDQVCLKCHSIAGAGGQVGPDLSSIGASAQVDYLIESILLPNKAIKENYHSLNVATKDGRLVSGIPIRQSDKELVLRDAEDKEVSILVKNIELREQGGSLMPEGLADALTRAELVDLIRFLSELGKVGPNASSKARLVRRWQVLSNPIDDAFQGMIGGLPENAASEHARYQWAPAYSEVAGGLPLDDLQHYTAGGLWGPWVFVRFQLEAISPGKIRLVPNSKAVNLKKVWIDGKSIDFQEGILAELKAGLHTITMAVQTIDKKDRLRVELDDVPGSPARVRIVNGK
jgi:putative heme-binding domain-containing protein